LSTPLTCDYGDTDRYRNAAGAAGANSWAAGRKQGRPGSKWAIWPQCAVRNQSAIRAHLIEGAAESGEITDAPDWPPLPS